jgi:tetratricopeptide (TPR) repeat protein
LYDYEYRGPRVTARLAVAAALTAIALDDSLAESHLALGIVRMIGPIDFARSESELRRALALDPRDRRTRSYLSKLYAWSERPDAALREARRLVDEDPLSTPALRELARALLVSRRYDEALAQLDRARTLGPPMRMAPQLAGEIYAARAMYPQAIAVLRTRNEPLTRALLGYALARAGDTSSARRVLDGFVSRWRHGNGSAMDIAIVYLGLGDLDRVFEWLDRALDECSIRGIIMEPLFDDLRADPRFAPVRGRLLGAVHRASSGARADLDSPRGRDARSRTTNGHRSGSRW